MFDRPMSFPYTLFYMNTNLSQLLQPFENRWVALSRDYRKVVASGTTLNEVEAKLEKNKKKTVVYFKVPRFNAVFVPTLI